MKYSSLRRPDPRIGAQINSASRAVTQSGVLVSSLEERRASVSGVSIDEEVSDLIRFQRGYEASARVIRTVDDMLQILLEL